MVINVMMVYWLFLLGVWRIDNKHLNKKTSKRLQEEAQKYGFEFIDTSFERESKVKEFFDEQIRSGKLERTDESYEKYYR